MERERENFFSQTAKIYYNNNSKSLKTRELSFIFHLTDRIKFAAVVALVFKFFPHLSLSLGWRWMWKYSIKINKRHEEEVHSAFLWPEKKGMILIEKSKSLARSFVSVASFTFFNNTHMTVLRYHLALPVKEYVARNYRWQKVHRMKKSFVIRFEVIPLFFFHSHTHPRKRIAKKCMKKVSTTNKYEFF